MFFKSPQQDDKVVRTNADWFKNQKSHQNLPTTQAIQQATDLPLNINIQKKHHRSHKNMPVAIKNNPNISIVNQVTEMTESRERDRSRSKKVIKIKKKNHKVGLDEDGKAKLETTF